MVGRELEFYRVKRGNEKVVGGSRELQACGTIYHRLASIQNRHDGSAPTRPTTHDQLDIRTKLLSGGSVQGMPWQATQGDSSNITRCV